jgi:pimeloyl-ACP methyl ester carboxylesterase
MNDQASRTQIHPSIAAADGFATTVSRDGTPIAYDRVGRGPAVVVVDGTFGSRTFGPNVKLPANLSAHHTVFHYDRRGCGASGDTRPYAVAREVEDLEAVIDAAGGQACVYGISSGAVLGVDAARRLPHKITKLAIYEPPCVVDDSRAPWPPDYLDHVTRLVASGRRGEAVKLWMRQAAALPSLLIAVTRVLPAWARLCAAAETIVQDGQVMAGTGAGGPLPAERFRTEVPTMVIAGAKSPHWLHHSADAFAALLPNAQRQTLAGQTHFVKPAAIAPELTRFFAA